MRASTVRVYPKALHSRTISPLDIPEILYHIFAFIDHFTLAKAVVLVCRQWFLMNRHRVVRHELWDANFTVRRVKGIVSRMPGTVRLSWSSGTDRLQEELDWVLLRKTLEQTHAQYLWRQQEQQQQDCVKFPNKCGRQLQDVISTLPFIDGPLKELELFGVVDDCKRLASIQSALPFLTRLKLQWRKTSTFHMDQLLLSCPLLEVLYAESTEGLELPGPWIPSAIQRKGAANHPILALKSLVLKNARLLQTSLENLLYHTPLTELRLVNLLQNEWLYWPFFSDVAYNWTELYQSLKRVPHQLKSFHFSVQDQTMTDPDLKAMMFGVCPSSTEWTFRAKDLTPTLTRYLNELPNVVTYLELFWPERAHCRPDSSLHAYLCASPHLLHLKAPNTALLFDLLDLHHRVDFDYSQLYSQDDCLISVSHRSQDSQSPSKVWKCRNLRTLHLAFHNHGLSLLTSPTHSRVLFGYISRVCPQLRDLEIHIPEQTRWMTCDYHFPNMDMRLHGGFCLLTRLKHLERLCIGRVTQRMSFDPVHLNWMVASGHSSKYRAERRSIAAGWAEQIMVEKRHEDRRMERAQNERGGDESLNKMEESLEASLTRDLQLLGLVLDVKEVLDEMDEKGYRCWPVLQRVSVFNDRGVGLRPADELMRLFPPKSSKLYR
ncbi:hypothetical protein BGZ95_004812 [Linnemannia exigua]|uniref:F-box domain-containing protein n=1 Tax=Linnemannia exigua TaxID=604196 RepID=A0AAD4DIV2_9FUNG|nr:hypothetical protein BGZ95_004812 [Linnemannia exigua]